MSDGELDSAFREDLADALDRIEDGEGAELLRRALRELPLDGAAAIALADRLRELQNG